MSDLPYTIVARRLHSRRRMTIIIHARHEEQAKHFFYSCHYEWYVEKCDLDVEVAERELKLFIAYRRLQEQHTRAARNSFKFHKNRYWSLVKRRMAA